MVLVGVGGAIGAIARYRFGIAVGVRGFPWATLVVNLVGTLALATLLGAGGESRLGLTTTNFLAVGLLGGFTTFSAFGYETLTMLRDDRFVAAGSYIAASVIGGLVLAAIGYTAGRALT